MVSAGAATWGLALPLRRSFADSEIKEYRLTAKQAVVNLTGNGYPDTAVWSYDGSVPGPELRIRQGDRVRVVVNNNLDEGTTVHWHGIRLPNAMDGVPGITQPSIRPGESFNYEFTPPDAGTFWYHPHADTLQHLGRGLAGALIIEEREPFRVDRDLLWVIEDWRLDDDRRIAPGFGNRMEAGMSGRRQHRHDQWTSSRPRIREGRGTGAASDCQRGARPDRQPSVRGAPSHGHRL